MHLAEGREPLIPSPVMLRLPTMLARVAPREASRTRSRPLAPRRLLSLSAYQLVARWLPPSTAPCGSLFRRSRAFSARSLLADMGCNVNIEHGASFGDGHK